MDRFINRHVGFGSSTTNDRLEHHNIYRRGKQNIQNKMMRTVGLRDTDIREYEIAVLEAEPRCQCAR